MRKLPYSLAIVFVGFWLTADANAGTINFDALARGEIVTTQYAASNGVTIFGDHFWNNSLDAAIIFDTLYDGPIDRDLQGPDWFCGNQYTTTFGNVLIIPERLTDWNNDGLVDDPDDEGRRPAGILGFIFSTPIYTFGFDLIDIELPMESGAVGFLSGGTEVFVSFAQLAADDSTIGFGNHSANRIAPIRAEDLSLAFFDEVRFYMGGSGAIDNITYTTNLPEPGSALMFCFGLAALGRSGRASRGGRVGRVGQRDADAA